MTKRILAMILCLALTLLACACAASDIVSAPESSETTGGKTPAPSVSTMEQPGTSLPIPQMSSQPTSSDEVSKPTEPTLPEERETTLEKVLSFEIGIDGLYDYGFTYYDDPSTADIYSPGFMYTNGDGLFYHVVDSKLVCLNDGAWLPFWLGNFICDIQICGDRLFLMTNDGIAHEYNIANGLANASLVKEYVIFKQYEEFAHFGYVVNDRPTVQYYTKEGNVSFPNGPYYTLEKKQLRDSELRLPYVYVEAMRDGSSIQCVDGEIKSWAVVEEAYSVLSATSDEITLCEANAPDGIGVLVAYDSNGNLLSRYGIQYPSSADDYETKSCERLFNQGGLATLKEYSAYAFTIDTVVFEDLVDSNLWIDSAGNHYFAAYYIDHCDVYRIDPGYSDREYASVTK